MIKYIVQFFIIFLLWWRNKKVKDGWLTSSGVLIGIYVICSLMGVIHLWIDNDYYTQPYHSYYWLPMLQFDLFILVFLFPFYLYNESKVHSIILPSRKFLDIFSSIIIILSFYSILFFMGSVRNIFTLSDLGEARNDILEGTSYFEAGIGATVASVAASNYCFAIILFFIYKIIGKSKKRCWLLLISSISNVIHVLAFVGRDGIIFWFFSFVFFYSFFRPYLQKSYRKQVMRNILSIGLLLLIPFFLITISRFGNSNTGTRDSIVSYMGHSFIQGPLFFGIDNKPFTAGGSFPLFYEITGMRRPVIFSERIIGDWVSWKFSTFVVGLYINLSLSGLIIVALGMFLLFMLTIGRTKRTMNFGQLTMYMLFFSIISEGVFYFKHYTRGGNLFIISTLVLALFFSTITMNTKEKIVLNKVK